MKNKILQIIITISRYSLVAFGIVAMTFSSMMAEKGNAQVKSVKEVRINVQLRNSSLKKVFKSIEDQTDFNFVFSDQRMDLKNEKVNLDLSGSTVEEALIEIAKQTGLKFRQVNQRISAIKASGRNNSAIVDILADVNITGKVTDENGEGLPGASVVVKGTTNGTNTDLEGNYKLTVPEDAVITLSYVGYQTQEIAIAGRSTIDIQMVLDAEQLEEIVVVGYGTEQKSNLTGSVSDISTDKLEARAVTNISAGLSGLAPGVLVTQTTGGRAGQDGASIRIRGIGTFNNSNPLIVVDGVASEGTGIINDIDPNDIENITILKDAASAAIYGSRGANGVVLITTKRGKAGEATFSYNGYTGWQDATRTPEYVSDFATYMEYANINRGTEIFDPADIEAWRNNPNDPLLYPNVDWYEEQVGRTARIQSHNLSFSGGSAATQYRFALSYLDQDGLTLGNEFQRYGLRTNVQSEVAPGVKIGGNLFFRWSELTPTLTNEGSGNVNVGLVPGIPNIQHPDGRWGGAQQSAVGTVNNPYAVIAHRKDEINQQRLLGDVFASWEVIEGLTATAKLALNYNHQVRNTFSSSYELWDFRRDIVNRQLATLRSGSSRQDQDYLLTANLLLEYKRSFGKHNMKVLGGYESLQFRDDFVAVSRNDFPNNEVQAIDAGLETTGSGGDIVEWSLLSYFGRANYNYDSPLFC